MDVILKTWREKVQMIHSDLGHYSNLPNNTNYTVANVLAFSRPFDLNEGHDHSKL